MTPRPLEDKVIVIIGGTTGLGLSAAQACVRAGAKVVVVGRDRDNARAAADGLGSNGKSLSGDASDPDTAPKAIDFAVTNFGGFQNTRELVDILGMSEADYVIARRYLTL